MKRVDIPAENLPALQAKFDKLKKKAAKVGSGDLTLEVVDRFNKKVRDTPDSALYHEFVTVEVDGEAPKYDGWTFVATIQHEGNGNILRKVPTYDDDVPVSYRNTDNTLCEHCGHRRARTDTFLVVNEDGEYKQVGRSCLKDFLGHQDPVRLASIYEMILSELDDAQEPGNGVQGAFHIGVDAYDFIVYANAAIRQFGWRSSAEDDSVRSLAWQALNPHMDDKYDRKFFEDFRKSWTVADAANARDQIQWIGNIETDKESHPSVSDYLHNLQVAIAGEESIVTRRTSGIVASLPVAYNRDLAKRKEKEIQKDSEHLSEVGNRITVKEAKVTFLKKFEGAYGITTLYKFRDSDNNELAWFSSKDQGIEVGDAVSVTGTVKKHDEYNGVKQTVITRCKVQQLEAA